MPAGARLPYRRAVLLLAVTLAAIAAASTRPPARAGTLSTVRSQAASAGARVTGLTTALVAADARQRAAGTRLAAVRVAAGEARRQLAAARSSLRSERRLLARLLVADYKSGAPSTTAFLLSSRSLSDLVARIEVANRAGQESGAALQQLRRTLVGAGAADRRLAARERAAAALVASIAARREAIARSLAVERGMLARLQGRIGELVAQTRAEAAARRREAAAGAPPPRRSAPAPAPEPQPSPPVGRATVVAIIRQIFGAHAGVALAIAERESGLDPNARNASGASGLFQLMPIWWRGKFDPFDPSANAAAAFAISRGGTDWSAWGGPP